MTRREKVSGEKEKPPAFQFYAKEFLADANQAGMSLQETGAYVRLMCIEWNEHGKGLPDDPVRLARMVGAPLGAMRRMWPALRSCFLLLEDGRLIHPRLEIERAKQLAFSRRQSDRANLRHAPVTTPAPASSVAAHDGECPPTRSSKQSISDVKVANRCPQPDELRKLLVATSIPQQKPSSVHAAASFPHAPGSVPAVPETCSAFSYLHSPDLSLKTEKGAAGMPPLHGRSKRPIYQSDRFVVFDWQLEDLGRMLGSHLDAFDLHGFFDDLTQRSRTQQQVIPRADVWPWLQQQVLAEAKRRKLPMVQLEASGAGEVDWDAIAKKGPSVRG